MNDLRVPGLLFVLMRYINNPRQLVRLQWI
jgi:hypothetical protein